MTKKTLMFGDAWSETDAKKAIVEEFEIDPDELEGYDILVAFYRYEDYSGDAYVLIRSQETGTLMVVQSGHCSCNGLEGSWTPEKTYASIELNRFASNWCSDTAFNGKTEESKALKSLLTRIANAEKKEGKVK